MTAKKLFLFWMLLLCQIICAQQDTIVKLKEVVVSDLSLQRFSNSLSVQKLNDSIIEKNQSSLTSLLQYNAVIYFKQNGFGMVSSPSFRGTTAQQTAVIWNGININSQLNGQTDFNTITTKDFESITVRAGGGSAIYGSSAIGGSIHLNNELSFTNQFQNTLALNYGSFNTFGSNYKARIANQKFSTNISISRNSSDNDYEYLGTKGKKNENGQFYNTSMNVSFGYKLNAFHFLKMYSQFYEGERHFSGTIASESKNKYQDFNTRNLVAWSYLKAKVKSTLKVAFFSEQYKYFENYENYDFETSKAETVLYQYDFGYLIHPKLEMSSSINYTQTKGTGSNIGNVTRYVGSAALLVKYQIFKSLQSELSIRQEQSNAYSSPLLFSFGMHAAPTQYYNIKLNVSRNFRMPTFNDLYWISGGNRNLKAEFANQFEIGQELHGKHYKFSATVYYNAIRNLLHWRPTNNQWSPENVGKVNSYGAEFLFDCNKKWGVHKLNFGATYAYTISKDVASDYQLTYVPYHKFTGNFAYAYQKFGFHYQYLFNGAVFTLNDNKTILKEYSVSNLGVDYDFGSTNTYTFGFQILNLANENYQSVPSRPLPGRNYLINLTIKF